MVGTSNLGSCCMAIDNMGRWVIPIWWSLPHQDQPLNHWTQDVSYPITPGPATTKFSSKGNFTPAIEAYLAGAINHPPLGCLFLGIPIREVLIYIYIYLIDICNHLCRTWKERVHPKTIKQPGGFGPARSQWRRQAKSSMVNPIVTPFSVTCYSYMDVLITSRW